MQKNQCDLEGRIMEVTQSEKKRAKQMKTTRDLWNNIKCANLHIIRGAREEERERRRLKMHLKKLWLKTPQA